MALPRTLEPEVMDGPDEAREYDQMDHREVNRRFVDDLLMATGQLAEVNARSALEADDEDAPCWNVLDLGTGTAQIPIELAQRVEQVRIIGGDAASSMLQWAMMNVDMASLRERIQLDQIDAKRLPYAEGMFDCVISNSLIHHVPDAEPVLREAARVCRSGGWLFVRDLLRPESEAEVDHLVATYAGQETATAQSLLRQSLHAALTVDEVRQLVAKLGFDPAQVNATSDRHWTWATRR